MSRQRQSFFGPGFLVTAAFIGPGTIATASSAGSGFGFALLWIVAFAVLATIVLQEMTARLGVVTGQGLGESLRATFQSNWARWSVFSLVIFAILFGNSAFQAGNVTGAASGLAEISGQPFRHLAIPIGLLAWLLLMTGRFRLIQNVLIFLVALMSLLFIVSAFVARPDWSLVLQGLFVPQFPKDSMGIAVALVGTTVVPYNLFLHSSSVAKLWGKSQDQESALTRSRLDAAVSILVGGAITAAILISGAVAFGGERAVGSLAEIAKQLEPTLGSASTFVFGIGLFSAGLTSAITAPLAAAYATAGCMGWKNEITDAKFRIIFTTIIVSGLAGCLVFADGKSPTQLILIAQFANGLLLPIIAVFLLVVMNNKKLLGTKTNGIPGNVLGVGIVLLTSGWGIHKVWTVLERLLASPTL